MKKKTKKGRLKKRKKENSSSPLRKGLNLKKKKVSPKKNQDSRFSNKNKGVRVKGLRGSTHVIFMYNSHEWDAYEVLGLPEGSSMKKVKEYHKKAISKVDQKSRAFFDAAYKAILIYRRRSSNQKN